MAKLKDDHIKWVLEMDAKGVQSELVTISAKSKELEADNRRLAAEYKEAAKQMKETREELAKLTKAGKEDSDQFRELEATLESVSAEMTDYKRKMVENNRVIEQNKKVADEMVRTLKVEDMTMEQLKKRAAELQKQFESTSKSTHPEAYAELEKQLNSVRGRISELDTGSKETEKSFSFFSSSATKGAAMFTAAIVVAKKGFNEFKDLMLSNKATGESFQAELDGISNALSYVQTAIANMDFSNFFDNVKEANRVGREMSIMLAELFERTNSFKLTSAVEKAEIEELKTQLRDVTLSEKERLEIGNQIIERTKTLAAEEKEIASQKAIATKELLRSQTQLTDAEMDYIVSNYNANRDAIQSANKIIELEQKRALFKNATNQTEVMMNAQATQALNDEINALKNSATFSEIAYVSMKKYSQANNELIKQYVDAAEQVLQIDINTNRELRRTETMMSRLTKSSNKDTSEQKERKELEKQKKALNEMLETLEAAHNKKMSGIRKEYIDGEIKSDSDYKRRLFAQEQAYYLLRETALEEFITETTKAEVKTDIDKKISESQDNRLKKEVEFQRNLEKIILNANPRERERREYEERLISVGLYDAAILKEKGESGEALLELTEEQKAALELLEKQHQGNIFKIGQEEENRKKAQSEKEFEEQFKARKDEMQLELNELMVRAQTLRGGESFDAEMAVHMQRLKMINEEIQARKNAGLEVSKQLEQVGRVETQLTGTIQKETAKRSATYNKYSTQLGTAMGEFLSGQKTALDAFGNAMLDILFDVLTQIINQKIIEATAVAIAEQAKAAAIASAMPDSVASFGVSGAVRTAAIGAIIMGALQAAKATLKGLIGKKSTSDNSSSSGSTSERVYSGGYAEGGHHGGYTGSGGKYDIKGHFSDGQPYHADEYIIPKEVLHRPDVVPIVRHLESIRRQNSNRNPLPEGFAEGGAHTDGQLSRDNDAIQLLQMIYPLLGRLSDVMEEVRDKKLELNYYEFERTQDIVERARSGARKR